MGQGGCNILGNCTLTSVVCPWRPCFQDAVPLVACMDADLWLGDGFGGAQGGSITAVMLSDRPEHLVGEQRRHSKAHRVRGLHKGLLP